MDRVEERQSEVNCESLSLLTYVNTEVSVLLEPLAITAQRAPARSLLASQPAPAPVCRRAFYGR